MQWWKNVAVTGADFLLKALMLQSIVGVFIAENPWQFSGLSHQAQDL